MSGSALDEACRDAYGALLDVGENAHPIPVRDIETHELPRLLEEAMERVRGAFDRELGPVLCWNAPCPEETAFAPFTARVDFDGSEPATDGNLKWSDSAFEPDRGFNAAATAYRRACGWDYAPGGTGIWLVRVAPTLWIRGAEPHFGKGNLIGFLILYDRDGKGYESVGHIWTARAHRRAGVASALLAEARTHFPLVEVEGPVTRPGAAFLRARAASLLKDVAEWE